MGNNTYNERSERVTSSGMTKLILTSVVASSWLFADISGVVYKDFDLNGEMNGGDAGISGVKVMATCSDGNYYEAITDKEGKYLLSGFPEKSLCRIEADPSNAGLGSAPNAKGSSAPLVDIVSDGATHNISAGSPATYCQENPDVILASTPGWFTDDDDNRLSPEGFGSIFKVPTPEIGDFNNNKTIPDKRKVLTNWEDTGAIWGAAWKKSTKELFVSAVIKRYVPLKDETTDPAKAAGAIYKVSSNGSVTLFATIDDVITADDENIIKSRSYGKNEDTDIKELVGTKGLGDLDISEDDKYLYTVNLKNKTLIKIDASTGDILSATPIPNPYGNQCNDDKVRPWALKVRGNEIFIGSVCEDEILEGDDPKDMDAGGLGAAIQKFDGSSFATVAQTNTLRFLRPKGYNPKKETNYQYQNTDWSHGSYEWLPQPMLTDIEFTNEGDLVLGYTDRSIMIRERSGSHGDIRKMCLNEDGSYTDESTAKAPTDCPSTKVEYKDNDEDYYEFYVGDYFNGHLGEDGHPETASGALAMAPGAPNIIVGMVDGTDWWQPGSIGLYSNENGDKIAAQAVINKNKTVDGGEREPYAAKAGGMGDVELLCDPAPIEIGNYVWMDLDEDGIQDPKEPPFTDVNVTLKCDGEEYGVATTDKEGHYYFGGAENVNLHNGKIIRAELDCELSIKKSDVNDKGASEQNPNNDNNDTIDNDAALDGNYNTFTFRTTASNDHTLDFGILPAHGCVTGQLYEDTNDNGVFDGTDKAAPANISLNIKDQYGYKYSVETDSNGVFTLDGILAGDITLSIDSSDTDIPDGSVWSDPGSTVSLTLSEGNSADGTCGEHDFPYTLPGEKDRDPKDTAVCAQPTSLTWDGSNVSTATEWQDLLDNDLENVETAGGKTVKITMHIDDIDGQFYDTDTANSSGSGTSAAFSEPYLTLYLGDQDTHGDGSWDSAGACSDHGYDLESGQKAVLTVDFNESVVLDNWRIRDVDSGDVRSSESDWEWQDGIAVTAYDAEGNEVAIEAKIGDSGEGLIIDEDHIVHTDKDSYDAGNGDFITGGGTSPGDTNGHIVLTSNFMPIKQLVITHSAGPDVPCQTRSALAMTGLAVCKPLHIAGTVYDDPNGTDQASCNNDDEIDGTPVNMIDGKPLHVCLVDENDIVIQQQLVDSDGKYDFSKGIKPQSLYGVLLTTSECKEGSKAPEGELAEGWKYEGETYTTSPDDELDGYVDVELAEESETKINFAINKVPTSKGYQRPIELNPEGNNQVDFIVDGSTTSDYIDDFENGTEVTIVITHISNGKLYYEGTEKSEGDTITDPDFSEFKVDPNDGDIKTTFTYKVVDQACRASEEALFEAPFNTIFISGNLFLDLTRNNTVDGEATPYSCDGTTQMYVNLVDMNNKVVSSKAVNESGSYGFYYDDGLRSETTYNIVLSTIAGKEGEDVSEATLTSSCAHADGEHIGADEGTDAAADGIIRVEVQKENIDEINFAITPTVKIGDRLWTEDDNDGDATTGEVEPVVDHEVTISCENGYSASTQTDNNGLYWFELLSNFGTCTVKTETPTDMTPAKGSKENNSVDDTSSENDKTHNSVDGTSVNVGTVDNLTLDFGFASVGDLCGRVTEDTNGNGRGDVAISNVTLLLYADNNADGRADGSVLQTTTTDSEGNYCFNKIQAANYVVNEKQPDGFLDVSENEGGDDHDMGNNGVANSIAAVVDAGEVDSGNDFVEIEHGNLCGNVTADTNNDGTGDTPIANVTLTLFDAAGVQVATTTTATNGNYCFNNLRPGDFTVKETQPAGYLDVSENEGGSDNDKGDNHELNSIAAYVAPGETDVHNDFVEVEYGNLCGSVTADTNNDDNGDEPIANVTLTLFDAAGTQVATTTTATNGNYCFNSLRPGDYTVKETQPSGYFDVSENEGGSDNDKGDNNELNSIAAYVAPGETDVHNDFVEEEPGSLCGNVSKDTNNDGRADAPIAGVTLTLNDAAGTQVGTTTTDSNGDYCFTGLVPGEYTVVETQPSGYFDVSEDEGGEDDDGTNDAVNTLTGTVHGGERDGHNDFVEAEESSLGDRVWYDDNVNGVQDADESGVANVTVHLSDTHGQALGETQTDANGMYRFDHLDPTRTYVVTFDTATVPSDYLVTVKDQGSESEDSDADPVTGKSAPVSVMPGTHYPDVDMGIHREGATEERPYFIGTHFWVDKDNNGKYDDGEEGIEGAEIELLNENGERLYWSDESKTTLTTTPTQWPAVTTTEENGEYGFYVPAGTYQVRFHMPENYQNDEYIFDKQRSNSDDSENINTANDEGLTQTIEVGPGHKAHDLTMDAGINCGCASAPVKSNGGDALGMFSMLLMTLMTLLSGLYFVRREEQKQGA